MHRRQTLRRLVVAGALGVGGGCVGPPNRQATTPTPLPDTLQRRLSLAGVETPPPSSEVRLEVSLLESHITDDHPARVRVTVTNTGGVRELSPSTGRCALFNRYSQTSRPRGLWLALAANPHYLSRSGPQWVADPPEDGAFPDYGCAGTVYASGESVQVEYLVVADARAGEYLAAGSYRFEEAVSVGPGSSSATSRSFTWGFRVNVENPHCTVCL